MTSIAASILGFDAKWDPSLKLMGDKDFNEIYDHEYKEMHKRMREARKAKKAEQKEKNPEQQPLSTEQFAAIFGGLGPQLTGFLHI